MKAINTFILCTTVMFLLSVLGKVSLGIQPLSVNTSLIIGFAVTWCIFKDRENENS